MTAFREKLNEHFGKVIDLQSVGGGDIANAYSAETPDGLFFVKTLDGQNGIDNLTAEYKGLQWLSSVEGVSIPGIIQLVLFEKGAFLAMDMIKPGHRKNEKGLGVMLAKLHSSLCEQHGWSSDNYIGRLAQSNSKYDRWPEFWRHERLAPQRQLALKLGYLSGSLKERLESLESRLSEILPDDPPSRLHGDLWNGNVIYGVDGHPYLIDPAVYAGHREVDLAMMQLFGGFGQKVFDVYQSELPLRPGWQKRTPIYQLYYALVHVNMFGRSYLTMVERLLTQSGF